MEQRIAELESRIAFQDEAIHSLSETVALQQDKIDRLVSKLTALENKIQDLEPSPVQSSGSERPPHY
jgi:SlyX protein